MVFLMVFFSRFLNLAKAFRSLLLVSDSFRFMLLTQFWAFMDGSLTISDLELK